MIVVLTGAHYSFVVETFFLTLMKQELLHGELSMLISWSVGMMIFWIENRYCYGLKVSETKVHRSNERLWEEFKDAIGQ